MTTARERSIAKTAQLIHESELLEQHMTKRQESAKAKKAIAEAVAHGITPEVIAERMHGFVVGIFSDPKMRAHVRAKFRQFGNPITDAELEGMAAPQGKSKSMPGRSEKSTHRSRPKRFGSSEDPAMAFSGVVDNFKELLSEQLGRPLSDRERREVEEVFAKRPGGLGPGQCGCPGWYVTLYSGTSPRSRNFRIKGYEGPYATKAEADRFAGLKKKIGWLVMVEYMISDPWTLERLGHPRFQPSLGTGRRPPLAKGWMPKQLRRSR